MRYFVFLVIFLQFWAGPVWAANDHGFPSSIQNQNARDKDRHGSFVADDGCLPTVPVTSLTVVPFPCDGYVVNGEELILARQLTPSTGTIFPAVDGIHWFGLDDTTTDVEAGWTRTFGTHYLTQQSATQPAPPDGGIVFAQVTIATVITKIVDYSNRVFTSPVTLTAAVETIDTTRWTFEPGGSVDPAGGALTLKACINAWAALRIFAGNLANVDLSGCAAGAASPMWFGVSQSAAAAAITNNDAALEFAINAGLTEGIDLDFPCGLYLFEKEMSVDPGQGNGKPTTLDGHGCTMLKMADTWDDTDGNRFWRLRNQADMHIQGFTFEGNRAVLDVGTEVKMKAFINLDQESHHIYIHHNTAQNCGIFTDCDFVLICDCAGVPGEYAKDIYIYENRVDNLRREMVAITAGENVWIYNNTYLSTQTTSDQGMVDLEANDADDTIQNIWIFNNRLQVAGAAGLHCIDVGGDVGNLARRIYILNNVCIGGVDGALTAGIRASQATDLHIIGNKFLNISRDEGENAGIFLGLGISQVALMRNTVDLNNSSMATTSCLRANDMEGDWTIEDNVLIDCLDFGMRFASGNALGSKRIVGGSIDCADCADWAINVAAGLNPTIRDLLISTAAAGGIQCSGCRIYDSIIRNVTGDAIDFVAADDNHVRGGTYEGTIRMDGPGETQSIVDVEITSGGQIALGDGKGIQIRGGSLQGDGVTNKGIAFISTSVGVLIDGTTISNYGTEGIFLDGTGHRILNTHIFDDQGTPTMDHCITLDTGTNDIVLMGNDWLGCQTNAINEVITPANYRPDPNGTFGTDMANFNLCPVAGC